MLAPLRKAWRRNAPQPLQIAVALYRRRVRDRLTGMDKDIVKPVQTQPRGSFTEVISLTSPFARRRTGKENSPISGSPPNG